MVMIDIYMRCGLHEEAMDEIDELLSIGTVYTANSLALKPLLDPIREHPRFREMVARHALRKDL